jgi:hypothetical protein
VHQDFQMEISQIKFQIIYLIRKVLSNGKIF